MLTRVRFDKSVLRMKHSSVALFVLAVISVLCEVIWIIINKGGEAPLKEFIYLLSHIPLMVLVIIFGKYYDKAFYGEKGEQQEES